MLAPFGFSFSVAGLLFPFHIGVIERLSSQGILTPSTPLNGASGGALAAACAAAAFSSEKSLSASLRVSKRCNSEGAFLNLEEILRDELAEICSDEMVQTINERAGSLEVLWTQASFPKLLTPVRSSQPFATRQSLIDVLTASSHIPLYSSISPFTVVTGSGLGVDGFLSNPSTLGCQDVDSALRTVNITPFAVVGNPSETVIAPTTTEIPFSPQDYVNLALGRPGPDEAQTDTLFELGEMCASRWLDLTRTEEQ